MKEKHWVIEEADIPIIATAIHNGHTVRRELERLFAIDENERLREEDPYTAIWTTVVPNRAIVLTSRFEVDMNRPREHAVYLQPKEAWGLKVWGKKPTPEMIEQSLAEYDAFYDDVYQLFSHVKKRFGYFVVLDLHTYNYRREGREADPRFNPDVNLGTGTIEDHKHWEPLIDRFRYDVQQFDFLGRTLDIRENVKFKGGHFPFWIHNTFGNNACVLSVEFKKFFMDEWSGMANNKKVDLIRKMLALTVPGLLEELKKIGADL
ncbi:MAG: N-formylglutamate amidohydrolase [Thiovulaceae bacterium]|nr:N-formylglutamate amidohydrolase [Sulfurimonadaceae bacterium]